MVEKEGLPLKQIDGAALERLKRYRWPGNVRELENLIRRLAALYPQETITEPTSSRRELTEAGARRTAAPSGRR